MSKLTSQQLVQEDEYVFPYHYRDLLPEILPDVDYLSRLHAVMKIASPFRGQSLLDAGCGDGRFCFELKDENINLTGVDFSNKALAFAKAFNRTTKFIQGDLSKLSFEKEFDVVTLLEVLEHVSLDDVKQVIDGLWRALKDNGRIIVSVPTYNQALSSKHYQHFNSETLVMCFEGKFQLTKIVGHSKSGKARKIYLFLCKFCTFTWFFRNHMSYIKKIVSCRKRFYEKHLEYCEPCDARVLIAEFSKIV